jgi:hypothetical protein
VVLPAFAAGGASLVSIWFATAWTYAILAVPILLPRHAPTHHEIEEYDMNDTLYVDKTEVIAQLRARQLHARAHWVDGEFPGLIDAGKNHSLLQMLGINLDAVTAEELTSPS